MSHLLAPQDEKKDSRATRSEPVIKDTSFLVPPQEEKAGQTLQSSGKAWLIPPQEEMTDVAALRGEQARLDQAADRVVQQVNKHRIEHDSPGDDLGRDKQQRDAILSGAAGTGEDLGIAENHRVVRP